MTTVQDSVIADMEARKAIGMETYGKPMLADDPDYDWLQDMYEELLDAVMYCKAELLRRGTLKTETREVCTQFPHNRGAGKYCAGPYANQVRYVSEWQWQ